MLQHPRIVRRLEAQREAIHMMEATLEALRAGAIPLVSRTLPPTGPRKLALAIEVTPEGSPPGLYRVHVRAAYLVEGQPKERSVETLLWRPPETEP